MDTPLDIRPLTEPEYPLAAELMARSIAAGMAAHYPADLLRMLIEKNAPAFIRERSVKQEDYLAWSDGRPVGYLGVKRNEIGHLFVAPDAGGRGVGTALVAFADSLFRARGHKTAFVLASLNAEPFYEKCGFHRTGTGSFDLQPGLPLAYVRMDKDL